MKNSNQLLLLVLLFPLMSACSAGDVQLETLASKLSDAVNRCLIDVTEKSEKYHTSENCRSLASFAQQYVEAGGLREKSPCGADRIAESARARAWMALAISKTGERELSIW
ncbi:MAG TPA: hypothetical protein VLD66_00500 [Methyloceanibacter sp.]|jgi:hypothetical protein|nr:hypothetical protein [Methyloceanibacter sp.]